jgi:GNAT superfamily N-acetyltransferase
MNIVNLLTLTIRVQDFNLIASDRGLIKKLRKLTLYPYSGMNKELNHLEKDAKVRAVDAKVLLAYRSGKLVAWALMSREESDFWFQNTGYYNPHDGYLLEMFVHPKYQRQGIGTELMKVARRKAGITRLCVAPWDDASEKFYSRFKNYRAKWL